MKLKLVTASLVLVVAMCSDSYGQCLLGKLLNRTGGSCASSCCDTPSNNTCEGRSFGFSINLDINFNRPGCGLIGRRGGNVFGLFRGCGCDTGCDTGCAAAPVTYSGCDSGCDSGCGGGLLAGGFQRPGFLTGILNRGCNSGCDTGCDTGCDSGCDTGCDDGCGRNFKPLQRIRGIASRIGGLFNRCGCGESACGGCDAAPACDTGCRAPRERRTICISIPKLRQGCGCGTGLLDRVRGLAHRGCNSCGAPVSSGCGCDGGNAAPTAAPAEGEVSPEAATGSVSPVVDPSAFILRGSKIAGRN